LKKVNFFGTQRDVSDVSVSSRARGSTFEGVDEGAES
jgi:hypothetical protein